MTPLAVHSAALWRRDIAAVALVSGLAAVSYARSVSSAMEEDKARFVEACLRP